MNLGLSLRSNFRWLFQNLQSLKLHLLVLRILQESWRYELRALTEEQNLMSQRLFIESNHTLVSAKNTYKIRSSQIIKQSIECKGDSFDPYWEFECLLVPPSKRTFIFTENLGPWDVQSKDNMGFWQNNWENRRSQSLSFRVHLKIERLFITAFLILRSNYVTLLWSVDECIDGTEEIWRVLSDF